MHYVFLTWRHYKYDDIYVIYIIALHSPLPFDEKSLNFQEKKISNRS